MLAPHHRVHGQFGVGGPTAEDLADPLVLVVLEAEFAERLGMLGSGGGAVDGIDLVGQPGRHAASLVVRRDPGHAERVAVRIGQHHPVELGAEAVPSVSVAPSPTSRVTSASRSAA